MKQDELDNYLEDLVRGGKIMKQDEFDNYLEDLVREAKSLNPVEGKFEKAGFQGVVIGLLSCEENAFTGRQVAKIIETVLDYKKAPGMRVPRGKGKNITRGLYIKSEVKTMNEIENMMTKSHSIAARTARNYREEEVKKYEALRDHRGNFRAADDGRGFRAGSEDDSGHNGRIGL